MKDAKKARMAALKQKRIDELTLAEREELAGLIQTYARERGIKVFLGLLLGVPAVFYGLALVGGLLLPVR